MKIYRDYRRLENIDELRIYEINEKELYNPTPLEFDVEDISFPQLISNIPMDVNIFMPHNDGNDFIIESAGDFILNRGNLQLDDVRGRLLSKISPLFFEIFHVYLHDVYKNKQTKEIHVFYYGVEKLSRITIVKIFYELDRIFLFADHVNTDDDSLNELEKIQYSEDKVNMIEYFTLTGSFRRVGKRYTWTQGIYNIINRPKEDHDEYYNIIFDLAIPEDQELVENIMNILDTEVDHHEDVIRIRTNDGTLKYLELNLYSNFDEEGNLISRYGLINDITVYSKSDATKPVDFLLNGFKHSEKMALLIEPLNPKHYEFSEGFYYFIEEDPNTYVNSVAILDNIVDEESQKQVLRLINGEVDLIDETFRYNVGGDENNQKICELYIERFDFSHGKHSLGFLADITDEMNKQLELSEANDHKTVLIKEVHHRVKNNLQILNSFLNLEKRVYRNQPDVIIDHMQSRLTSLALLHEITYNTNDFKNINLSDFIRDQDNKIRALVGMKNGVEFDSEIDEDLTLTIEVITPLLLIIDELNMNALKHAFPDKTVPNKKITKKITQIDEHTGQLTFKDNGVGMEDPSDFKKNLGCEIIKNLTKQLDGKIELVEYRNGTEYKLTFPINMRHTIHG